MTHQIIINREGLNRPHWSLTKSFLRVAGFEEQAGDIYSRDYEDKNKRDEAYYGLVNWLKRKGINPNELNIQRLPLNGEEGD